MNNSDKLAIETTPYPWGEGEEAVRLVPGKLAGLMLASWVRDQMPDQLDVEDPANDATIQTGGCTVNYSDGGQFLIRYEVGDRLNERLPRGKPDPFLASMGGLVEYDENPPIVTQIELTAVIVRGPIGLCVVWSVSEGPLSFREQSNTHNYPPMLTLRKIQRSEHA